ncbi:MAG: creatininase family protein [Aggregatilineales bacterium]
MIWDQLTSPALAKLDRSIPVILPIAATEQHGPHLPLATDRMIAEHFMKQLNERLPESVLVLPTVQVGCSEHHMDFAGSLTLTHETYMRQLNELLESVAKHGFTNLVIFNSHGGNIAIGQVVLEAFGSRHPNCQIVMMTWWQTASTNLLELSTTGPGGIGHAGEFETSLMLHIAPHLVDRTAIMGKQNQPTYFWAEGDMLRKGQATIYRSILAMTPNGVYGDPTSASADKGKAITQIVLAAAEKIITSLHTNY